MHMWRFPTRQDNEKQGKQAELQSFQTATMYQNADKRRHPD